MYMDKQVKRGYNEYIRLDEGIGKDAMMDVALLVMEDGDTWSCEEPEKEVAALVFDGKCTIKWENESYDVDRPNPFDCTYARASSSRSSHTVRATSTSRRL